MPATTKPSAVTVVSFVRTASAALDEIADANKQLLVQQKRMQTLLDELLRYAQDGPKPARATRKSAATRAEQESASASARILQVQIAMQRENLVFTSISNVLKTRHDTIKNSLGNIR